MKAEAESRRLGQDYIGTEMLLVGVAACEGDDAGCRAMARLSVTLPKARALMNEVVGQGAGTHDGQETYFTIGAKKALQDATECAWEQGATVVGTSHLLRAILLQESGCGAKLLQRLMLEEGQDLDPIFAMLTLEECVDKVCAKRSL